MKYIIVGTGNISNTYINALAQLPQSELVGGISRTRRPFSLRPEIPIWGSLEEADVAFDAVILATPNGLHGEGIRQAARLGKHVLTEKPLGIDRDDMDAALAACEAAGITMAVAYQRRTVPDNRKIQQLLREGALGRVFAADLSAKFYRDQGYYDSGDYRGGYAIDGGGPFMQQACHNIDLYVWFFGLPEKVVAFTDTFAHNMEAEDHGAALLRYPDGMIGTIIASTIAKPGFAARLEVHTEKGTFTMLDDVISEWQIDGVENPATTDFKYTHDGATSVAVHDTSAHERILRDFESAVHHGHEPLVSGRSARDATELILRIYEAGMK